MYDDVLLNSCKNVNVVETIKTRVLFSIKFMIYKVMCPNVLQPERPQIAMQCGAKKNGFYMSEN
jgi:hypothetical protein